MFYLTAAGMRRSIAKKAQHTNNYLSNNYDTAIALAEAIINRPDTYIQQLNQNSLGWRGKL